MALSDGSLRCLCDFLEVSSANKKSSDHRLAVFLVYRLWENEKERYFVSAELFA